EFTSYRGRRSREEATGTPSVTPVGTQIPDEPLKICDRLMLLIDVPNLLMSGAGAVADQSHLIVQVLKALVPKREGWRSLGRGLRDLGLNIASAVKLSLRPGKVERVAFVATKADLVAISDVRENRLSTLLSQVINPTCSYLEGIEPVEFVLSAVKSTSAADKHDDDKSPTHAAIAGGT
ncbi:MAG TPA: YcjX family protein, partial [Pirellulales bacterium]|nr:YcjX family protein [Pirellulales bacterium]